MKLFVRALFYAFSLGFGVVMFVIYPANAPAVAWLFAAFGCSVAPMLLMVMLWDMTEARHFRTVVRGE